MDLYEILDKLNIKYEEVNHKHVFTAEEAQSIKEQIEGVGAKNLFLTDRKGNYFLYLIEDCKQADIKMVSKSVNISHLSFASTDELKNVLNLERGSVTPMGIINDKENVVTILIDKDLEGKKLLVHPNTNIKTLSIDYNDLIKFIEYHEHKYLIIV